MRHGSTLPVLETTVVSDWVDYNGHMNDAAYAIVFSRSVMNREFVSTRNGVNISLPTARMQAFIEANTDRVEARDWRTPRPSHRRPSRRNRRAAVRAGSQDTV